ncbi:hypothetical protein [Paraburkholderia sacchari]|uniref:Secreted protein n=1 Tax=Paraburkholderia sacchari TaxID=159450 RepID=A0A8T6Z9W1_9BURK|nr:hypothetical protein [Paraburkholderia sacchari]NLP61044.1 hypothetical protein [Paraburkholderia sacchari]
MEVQQRFLYLCAIFCSAHALASRFIFSPTGFSSFPSRYLGMAFANNRRLSTLASAFFHVSNYANFAVTRASLPGVAFAP